MSTYNIWLNGEISKILRGYLLYSEAMKVTWYLIRLYLRSVHYIVLNGAKSSFPPSDHN